MPTIQVRRRWQCVVCCTLHQDRKTKFVEALLMGLPQKIHMNITAPFCPLTWATQLLLDIFPHQLFLPLMLVISCMHISVCKLNQILRHGTVGNIKSAWSLIKLLLLRQGSVGSHSSDWPLTFADFNIDMQF